MHLTQFFKEPGKPFPYHPKLANKLGINANAMILLSFVGWGTFEDTVNGWVKCSKQTLFEETALSFREQETARAKLVSLNLIEEKYERLEHQFYIRLTPEKEADAENAFREKQEDELERKTRQPDAENASTRRGKRVSTYKNNYNQVIENTVDVKQTTSIDVLRQEFIERWKATYKQENGKDGSKSFNAATIKEIDVFVRNEFPLNEVFDVVKRAWRNKFTKNNFWSKNSKSIKFFCVNYEQIAEEVNSIGQENGQQRENLKAKNVYE